MTKLRLPLLHYFSREEESKKPLKDFVLLLIQHLLGDSKAFISALEAAGAERDKLIIVGIPYSSKDNIVSDLRKDYKVYSPRTYPFDNEVRKALSEAFGLCSREKQLIIIEDGGYATPMIHQVFENYIKYCRGAIEQTTNGIWRIEESILKEGIKLGFPVISIPDCKLKQELEPHFIGEAVVRNTQMLISEEGLFIRGKKIGIVGYGTIGSKIADETKKQQAIVSISEINPVKLISARLAGFETKSLLNLVKESDIIIGATGRKSIGREQILSLKNNAILVNASSKRIEIDVEELEKLCLSKEPTKIGTWYELVNGNKVLLLADGFPVNFFSSESVPDKAIDPILTLMFLGAIRIAKENLEPKIHKCPIQEDEIAKLFSEIHFT